MAERPLGEFERIERFFRPLAAPEALGLLDDAAVLDAGGLAAGGPIVLTMDAIVEGVHFLPDDPPDLVARKLLRVNLSDLAAMGAAPVGYLLATALPARCGAAWLERFAAGLAADQAAFGFGLLGGDSVSTPGPITLSVTALGRAPRGAVRRSLAQEGDAVFVSGSLGDAALGLACLTGERAAAPSAAAWLADRYRLPQPRLALGLALAGIATAMCDVSDGLAADLGHISAASGLAATIEAAALPLSDALHQTAGADALAFALTGGDDYELVFTVPQERIGMMAALAEAASTPVTRIGSVHAGRGVRVVGGAGETIEVARGGFTHF